MADTKPVQSGNKYEIKKKEKQKKKEKTKVSLPNAGNLIRKQRAMAQGKTNYTDFYNFIGVMLLCLLILFVLLGGVSQRGFWEASKRMAEVIGQRVSSLFDKTDVELTDDGIYLVPSDNTVDVNDENIIVVEEEGSK